MDKIDFLWHRRALILKEIEITLGLKDTSPHKILSEATKIIKENESKKRNIEFLLKALKNVRMELFKEWKARFAGVFNRAERKFGQEGAAILEEKLLQCIDHCNIGQENTFVAFFGKYALRGFSEIEDERMGQGFSISRKKKLLLRKINKICSLEEEPIEKIAREVGEDIRTIKELMAVRIRKCEYPEDDGTHNLAICDDTPESILIAKEEIREEKIRRHKAQKEREQVQTQRKEKEVRFWWDLPLKTVEKTNF